MMGARMLEQAAKRRQEHSRGWSAAEPPVAPGKTAKPRRGGRFPPPCTRGSALLVVLWLILSMSLLIGGLAYEMGVEAHITSHARKRLKAQVAARGGVEYAKFLLARSFEGNSFEESDEALESLRIMAKNLERGIGVNGLSLPVGDDTTVRIDILPEAGRRNVNKLEDEDWEELLDLSGVPEDQWPDLIDAFMDFVDPGDEHRLNGAERDDAFYKSRSYEPKNAELDTIDELLLVKGFTPELVYGGPNPDPKAPPFRGIAHLLTTFGDGKVNINTASREVLMTLTGTDGELLDEWAVDDILKYRLGDDGLANTEDDGFESVSDAISKTSLSPSIASKLSVSDRQYVRVTSIGECNGVRSGVWAIFEVSKNNLLPLYWREETPQ